MPDLPPEGLLTWPDIEDLHRGRHYWEPQRVAAAAAAKMDAYWRGRLEELVEAAMQACDVMGRQVAIEPGTWLERRACDRLFAALEDYAQNTPTPPQ